MRDCKCGDCPLSGGDISTTSPANGSRKLLRGGIGLVEWLVPAATLALIPKCPMCLAAYVAIGTGIGISVSAATYMRLGLIAACVAALLYLTWRKARLVRSAFRARAL